MSDENKNTRSPTTCETIICVGCDGSCKVCFVQTTSTTAATTQWAQCCYCGGTGRMQWWRY